MFNTNPLCNHSTSGPCVCQAFLGIFLFLGSFMFNKPAIYERFASCYSEDKPARLARIFGVKPSTVYRWESGEKMVPRARLKKLVDDQKLSWDWLLEGKPPKHHSSKKQPKPFDRHEINPRFLGLFPDMSQETLGGLFSVHQTVVSKWHLGKASIPWETLKYTVDNKGVTWEWLLEGRT